MSKRRLPVVLVSSLVLLAATFGLPTVSGATEKQVGNGIFNCVIDGPTTQNAGPDGTGGSDAGGALITVGITCNGNKHLTVNVEVKTATGKVLFKVEDEDNVQGGVQIKKMIHLPINLEGAVVCVDVINTESQTSKCVNVVV